ncbi:MAG: DNA polymerase II large subunit [Candidatus Nezhaarchaeales archaeon]
MTLSGEADTLKYFNSLSEEVKRLYEVAKKARSRGFDPTLDVEVRQTDDLAARVEEMIRNIGEELGVANRIRELCKSMPREEVAFKVAEEIAYGKYGKLDDEKTLNLGIRVALAILTEGITAAPIQGIDAVRIKSYPDGTRYASIYFAGPIRSAGGTAQALTVLVGDHLRRILRLERYKPSEEEVRRFIEEIRLYEREVARFQYHHPDSLIETAIRNIPVEVTGVPTDPVEVSIHRDLPRIETNRVRGGALRVINDGILGKAAKLKRYIQKLGLTDWDWLLKLVIANEEGKAAINKYLADVVAGRPVFSYPAKAGGFRLRYGRARNTGLAAVGIHPATLEVLQGFLAIGTQVKMEGPGKAAIVVPVDTIEGPIVKLNDGSVLRIEDVNVAKEMKPKIEEILHLGDLLVSFSEFLTNNQPLLPAGYCEEWWIEDLKDSLNKMEHALRDLGINPERLRSILEGDPPTGREALIISRSLNVPLHPKYTYFWKELKTDDVLALINSLRIETFDGDLVVKVKPSPLIKRVLERLGVPHSASENGYVITGDHAFVIAELLRPSGSFNVTANDGLEFVNKLSGLRIVDKAPTYVGLRMGRPEKAAERKMKPPVHVLFPVDVYGGSQRDIVRAAREQEVIKVDLASMTCPTCGASLHQFMCPKCGVRAIFNASCPVCKSPINRDQCPKCGRYAVYHAVREVRIKDALEHAFRNIGEGPSILKGVRGLTNLLKIPEPLEKGIFRSKYGLSVYKDGTIRFDATNAPLTHFKPEEVGVDVERLKQLGYEVDFEGRPLERVNQLVELKVQDVIIPEKAANYLVKVAKYVDELLTKFYKLEAFYKVEKPSDLVGHIIVGMSPHTSAGVVGRIIGFTKANVCFAHPYWHAAKRRNCDGDEDSISLALDVLINFSKLYLPERIGGFMDAPLVLVVSLNPREVDDEVHNLEVHSKYPKVFYEHTLRKANPKKLEKDLELVSSRLGSDRQYHDFRFTHGVTRIDLAPLDSTYKKLGSVFKAVKLQLELARKIRAVDVDDVVKRILSLHLLPDLIGNLRAYTRQIVRCKKCGERYRRPPLIGICPKCSGKLSLSIHSKSVTKYLTLALNLIEHYDVGPYIKQRVKLVEREVFDLFKVSILSQKPLTDYL